MIDIDYYYRFIDQLRLEKRGNKETNKKSQSIVGTFVAVELYRDYSLHFVLKKVKFSFKYYHWQVTRETHVWVWNVTRENADKLFELSGNFGWRQ